ncbi:hypothetical protein M3O96_12835 [Aquiflexum sp. TKW24L]|uniref:hypothetical protein n=1 Tax=Aquiflexum sp. TKW24L TaxID=2942212 RepID=UPI0020BFE030|nr:hypothetical protein [Aquiflexum sp. TKW24L]MCL6259981.1 hypothetical protein [Aquiflexum sp. TKW24L]
MQSLTKTPAHHLSCLLLVFLLSGILQSVSAQEFLPKVPTPVEFMVGNNRMFFQMVVKKKFSPESKFGFLSVSSLSASYDNNKEDLDLAMPVLINYNIYKGFGLVGGTSINNAVGFAPLLGAQHSFANKEWVAVTVASAFLHSKRNVELFGIYEYKPSLSPKTSLYTRVQFLYIHSTRDNLHARSFLQLRAGLKMNALNFGLGANLDQYGPEKRFKPNYGVFVGWAFQ